MNRCSIFSARGVPDSDREYRHPRACTDLRKQARRASLAQHAPPEDEWENLPPLEELVDGVSRFTRYYFQLGFLPKEQYLERLRTDYRSVNVFLLVSILSISARLSPPLSNRFGNGIAAAKYFTQRAARTSLHQIYETPSLERCQAFYLLSIAQQGSGDSNKSYVRLRYYPLSVGDTDCKVDQHGHLLAHGGVDASPQRGDIPLTRPYP